MTAPTRGQVQARIDAEFNAFFEFPGDDKSHVTSVSCKLFTEVMMGIARAHALDDAKAAVTALHSRVADAIFGQERHDVGHAVIDNCAKAIEALKGKP